MAKTHNAKDMRFKNYGLQMFIIDCIMDIIQIFKMAKWDSSWALQLQNQ